ncbi:MAG: hypothetical protein IJU95_06280 [Treponema sp.]|nr:hypothetical protein [Treponema sp.]
MGNKDFFSYGEEILNSINKAAETGDFSNLSRDVKNSISGAASAFTSSLSSDIRGAVQSGLRNTFSPQDNQSSPFFAGRVSRYGSRIVGLGKIIMGSIIIFIMSLFLLGGIISFGDNPEELGFDIGLLIFSAASIFGGATLIWSARNKNRLVSDYFRFGDAIGNKTYVTIKELCDKTGMAAVYVVRQLKKMKSIGYLPYAVLDRNETTLMLTDEVYKEYLRSTEFNSGQSAYSGQSRQNKKHKQKEEQTRNDDSNAGASRNVEYYTIDESLPGEVKDILREGIDYLNEIRFFNDLIPDTETMSDKLYTLEATALSIFKKLKETPEIAGDLRKFMAYYLPTTKKLLQSYVNQRKTSQTVETIAKSQKEIEEATDVINEAFVKLLNQLFESDSWDISSDISVMKTMMKQDALL